MNAIVALQFKQRAAQNSAIAVSRNRPGCVRQSPIVACVVALRRSLEHARSLTAKNGVSRIVRNARHVWRRP